jgi:hypothetical protein
MLGDMSEDARSPAQYASGIDAARERLVAGCSAGDLQADEGRVERLVQIAIRHADGHRAEIEAGLAVWSGPGPG